MDTYAGDPVTLALLKPDMMRNAKGSIDELLRILEDEEFELVLRTTFAFSEEQAHAFYSDVGEWGRCKELLQYMHAERWRIAMQHWQKLMEGDAADTWTKDGERLPSLRYKYRDDPNEGRNGPHGATATDRSCAAAPCPEVCQCAGCAPAYCEHEPIIDILRA